MADPIDLRSLRRDLHRHPEPAWCEYWTTARIVEECERIGVDELYVGPDAIDSDARLAVPDDETLSEWAERARAAGVDAATIERLAGGHTGAVAVLRRGEGPTVALRVDIDALPRDESTDEDHTPAAEGFRSKTPAMHACGHDAHAAIGLGVLQRIADSDFSGTLKLLFQPAEEVIGGGQALADSGHLDDVDALFSVHVGLDHPTGEVVAGVGEFLAVSHFEATFHGESAHAGAAPQDGRNALLAATTATNNLYGISRHADGRTRVNVGVVEGGTAPNIVAEEARIVCEVRGEATPLMEYMRDRADQVVDAAAAMHDCSVAIDTVGQAPSATSDDGLIDLVVAAAEGVDGVDSIRRRAPLGGSEDATVLMNYVQNRGGTATYVGVGTDHPGGHHTSTFDVDEESIAIGVDVLSDAIRGVQN